MIKIYSVSKSFHVSFKDWEEAEQYLFRDTTLAEWLHWSPDYIIIED